MAPYRKKFKTVLDPPIPSSALICGSRRGGEAGPTRTGCTAIATLRAMMGTHSQYGQQDVTAALRWRLVTVNCFEWPTVRTLRRSRDIRILRKAPYPTAE